MTNKGCAYCFGDSPLFWESPENCAFIDSTGNVTVTLGDREATFPVPYCPMCGISFAPETDASLAESQDAQVRVYLADPDTRVYISENDELGYTTFAVVVQGSNGFWLDSFPNPESAAEYIKTHGLTLAD